MEDDQKSVSDWPVWVSQLVFWAGANVGLASDCSDRIGIHSSLKPMSDLLN